MTREITATVLLPVGVEEAYAVLTGPGWPAALDAHLHDGSALVRADPTPEGGVLVELSRKLPDQVPAALKGLLPKDGRVTQSETWGPAVDGQRASTWSASFPGAPGTIGGESVLEPAEGGSRWTVRGAISISVPFVGGKIEGFLAPLVEGLVSRQGEVLADELS